MLQTLNRNLYAIQDSVTKSTEYMGKVEVLVKKAWEPNQGQIVSSQLLLKRHLR